MMIKNEIILLDDIEHVLTVPGRYIGSITPKTSEEYIIENDHFLKQEITYIPAILTLFREVLSNSIDEFTRTEGKFANKIDVSISDDRRVISVSDNGRGLPHEPEEKTGLPQSLIAFTRLKSGTNFKEKTTSIGQNGEGVSLVNIFSKKFKVETSDGVKKTLIVCSDNLSKQEYKLTKNNTKFTEVSFELDFERFNIENIDDIHFSLINKILIDMSICYPDIRFTFNKKVLPVKKFKEYVKMYTEFSFETFNFNNIDMAVIPSYDYEQVSFVNGIYTRRGGSHMDAITYNIIDSYRDIVAKKYQDIKPADIKNKLFFIVVVKNFTAPRFDSQTKEELINNKEDFDYTVFGDFNFKLVAEKIKANKFINDNILEAFKIKEELKKRKELEDKEKKLSKLNIPKLIEVNNNSKPEDAILYIAEGDSALVNFLECRENYQAAFPLSGKINNVNGKDSTDLVDSKKISELVKVLGLKLSSKSINSLRYGKIAIFTDADYDGDCILCLLINLFHSFWPNIIKEGKLFKAVSPLIIALNEDTKKKKYFFSNEEYNNAEGNWKILAYNKGLGSLDVKEYKYSLSNLVRVEYDENAGIVLDLAFGKKPENRDMRKEWMVNNFK